MDRIVLDHARELEDVVAENVLALQSELVGKERMLLFCLSHKDCDRMAELLHWKAYHSHISLEDRSAHMMLWKEGSIKGLACTSMLNCCLDYSTVRYVFHLEAPRDVVDYYQAIGRCARDGKLGTAIVYYTPCRGGRESTKDDPFGKSVLWEMLHGRTVNQCRRVSPSEFLDGFGIPCTMLPDANFCDVCSDAMASATHAGGWSHSSSSPIMPLTMSPRSFVTTTPPPASFGTHLVAALSSLKPVQPSQEEQLGLMIRQACDVLSNHCVCCWVLKLKTECTSHRLIDCERFKSTASEFSQWMDDLLKYVNLAMQKVRVHEHDIDDTCHWVYVFKPLAYLIFHVQDLKYLIPNGGISEFDSEHYARWLCEVDGAFGVTNLVKLVAHISELIPLPVVDM
ncbi:hypothetical protein K443DRAFT_15838 [Laccaria amethystina LaAM-08-1]|uniref:DNA 3'-5' helicase n=1 Tax=Laccaria amethystina LaAM-08-1 TaxID=1095629 RepID=A0A0C9WWM5_9AGAR|nr:hypothetical protein K443DRAFT_15838 [Laccaria amethystina LaAM-08-1]